MERSFSKQQKLLAKDKNFKADNVKHYSLVHYISYLGENNAAGEKLRNIKAVLFFNFVDNFRKSLITK